MRMTCVGLGWGSGNGLASDAGCAASGVVVAAISIAAEAAECQILCIGCPRSLARRRSCHAVGGLGTQAEHRRDVGGNHLACRASKEAMVGVTISRGSGRA